ncbi:hypothetical protein Afil01_40600 [Actinorhabdospora filicis]|uniref:Uncharacterized protein n=1 Tax=Actinorhabdospora filicis TaxID=1785913 RepID=A0A9W6WAQ3_9ACTN|nr:hypothetical protein [Actinorhabdospora filicis]GLZ79253.1 hypothetical protein Afil01_40600 [Actinorhabdospora filicis]
MAPSSLDIAAQRGDPRSTRPSVGQKARARKPWTTDRAGRARTLTMLQSAAGNAAVTRLLTKGAATGYGALGGKRELVEAPPATPTVAEATGERQGPETGRALIDEQREAVTVDARESEERIGASTAEGEDRIGEHFGGVREGLGTLLDRSEAEVRGFIDGRRNEATAASAQATASAQSLVDGTVAAAQGQGEAARQTIGAAVDGASTSLEGTVQGLTGQITGVVNRISLPDLPGVGRLRSLAAGLVNGAASTVSGGLAQVRSMLNSALQTGTRMVGALISQLGKAATSALAKSGAAIQRGVQAVANGLGRVATLVLGAVRRVVGTTILPAVNRLENRLVRNLGTARRQAVTAVRANRDESLRTLAATSTSAAATAPGAAALRGVTEGSREGNRGLLATFRERTGGILGSVFQALTAGAAQITAHVGGLLGQAQNAVAGTVGRIVAGFGQITAAVSEFAGSLLRSLTSAVGDVVGFVQGLIQDPARALTDYAGSALTAITGLPARLARNVLSGDFTVPSLGDLVGHFRPASGGPITKPRPPGGPITLPGLRLILLVLATFGAIIVYAFPQLMAVVTALVALGLTPLGALIVVGLAAILVLVALLLLLYLLWKLATSKPKPPDPEPVITHETAFTAPDGSPKSRGEVGVGEKVLFTGSASGAWTATAGTPASGTGDKFTWTAPDRAATATITLTVGAKSKSVDLKVVEPASITAHRNRTIPIGPGTAGAGMKLTFHYSPKHVSFGNVEAKEVSGPATNITGYFRKHFSDADLWHDSGDTFYPIKENNEDSAEDTASLTSPITPWEAGTFDWIIPNHFKTKTESGDGKKFTDVTQAFQMLDATGRVRIDKAGASVERSPSDP